MALIHANCYGSIIREYLYSSFQFKKEYYIYNIPPIHEIISGSLYSEKEIKENFDNIFEEFDSKERKWDIRIVDYIKKNYKEKKLFYDINHPTNEVMEKIAMGICKLLNIPIEKLFCTMNLGAYEMPIYPEVRLTLGLKYGKANEEIRKESSLKLIEHMDLREYLLEYAFWCVAEEKEKDKSWLGQ